MKKNKIGEEEQLQMEPELALISEWPTKPTPSADSAHNGHQPFRVFFFQIPL